MVVELLQYTMSILAPKAPGSVLATALLLWAAAPLSGAEPGVAGPAPASARKAPLRFPERRPSSGLAWSKAQYPEQYRAHNVCSAEFEGVADFENERFVDVACGAYSKAFLSGFSYSDPDASRPKVWVDYLRRAETFVGTVTARGLKPNFAYQLKLRGLFSDRPAFERIGRLGRWRLPGNPKHGEATDEQYDRLEDKSRAHSYLSFDFIVTDPWGNAQREFYADSSLHVLWNTAQNHPGAWHSQIVEVRREQSDPDHYANPRPDFSSIGVFAESEHLQNGVRTGRPNIGEAFLPPGTYSAELVLTEESFHGYGDGGFWATVMRTPVRFEIADNPRPSPYWRSVVPAAAPLAIGNAGVRDIGGISLAGGGMAGVSTGTNPFILFAEKLRFPDNGRFCLVVDLLTTEDDLVQVVVYSGKSFTRADSRAVLAGAPDGWHRFEIEITSLVRGRRVRLRIDPASTEGRRLGVRNVRICRIQK